MPIYNRCSASEYEVVDRWDGGIGWLAHPNETGHRTSHAVVGEDGGVWLIDPIDAPRIDEELSTFGDVRGVIVCSNYHVRGADVFAARYDVPVYCPPWLSRGTSQLDASIEPETNTVGTSGFELRRCRPFPGWSEAIAYRGFDETLYVPDVLGTSRCSPWVKSGLGCTFYAGSHHPRPCSKGCLHNESSSDTAKESLRTPRRL
ncbi:hypothetical protein [Halorubrum distributum]|uniref:Metallo-beta-lactamase domain-containing protein n=1 Tax=Halorubrum distributum JCM 13916 TaxID=1230455 RepID=M0PT51_9EURY|nr:hypothetical protein [Halorubrum arcis]EMA72759.1 hypothetical protein C462_00142 [Halorubrum arcis JCM 13916]